MNYKILAVILFTFLLIPSSFSQTIVLQPTGSMGKDAVVQISDNGLIDGNTNFGSSVNFIASRINSGGNWYKTRSLIQYDFSAIPEKAIITSATLILYGVAHNTSGQSNASVLQRITSYWDENIVTWNNQPLSTASGQIAIAGSTTSNQNYNIDVKKTVQDMITNPSKNFGWVLKLNGEGSSLTSALSFGSSDNTTSAIRPRLEITYTLLSFKQLACTSPSSSNGSIDLTVSGTSGPYSYSWTNEAGTVISTSQDPSSLLPGAYKVAVTDASSRTVYGYAFLGNKSAPSIITFQPSANYGTDAPIATKASTPATADGNNELSASFLTYRWTISGLWQTNRTLLSYDFSSIPKYAIITNAKLYLYGTDHATTEQTNAGSLQRITNPWTESFVTWNNQPNSNPTGKVEVTQTATGTENKILDITAHVQDMIRAPESNFGWVMKMNGEFSNLRSRMIFASSDYTTDPAKRPKLEIEFFIPEVDENRNWVDEESFDDNGNTKLKSRTYLDALGRNIQVQSLDLSSSTPNVLAASNVFDAFGRPTISTLAAPIYQNGIYYKDKFIADGSNTNYSYDDFDKPNSVNNYSGEVNNPVAVNSSTQGSLGWYYSNNNSSESYVPASSFPYSRVEYFNDPLSRVKSSSGPGESHRMGSGHELENYYMSTGGELYYVYGYKSAYILGFDQSSPEYKESDNLNAFKTVQVDADDKESVSFTNSSGQVIASCLSGMGTNCKPQKVSQIMYYHGERGITVHLPASKKNTLKLFVPAVATSRFVDPIEGSNSTTHKKQIDYFITDLTTGKLLVESTDYTINRTTRLVTFTNGYQNGSGFFRISFEYTTDYINERYNPNYACSCQKIDGYKYIPDLAVSYELDYSDWTLNYFDKAGNLVKTVSNQAIDCNYDPITDYTITNAFISKEIQVSNTCSTPLHTISTPIVSNFDQAMKVRVEIFNGYSNCSGQGSYKYSNSSVSDGSNTKTVTSISIEEDFDGAFLQSNGIDTTNGYRYFVTDLTSVRDGQVKYEYVMLINLCNNAGTTVAPTQFLNLNGIDKAVDFYLPQSIMANSSSIKVKLLTIEVHKFEYNATFHDYVETNVYTYVSGNNTEWDNALCHYRLGITSALQKYPTPNNINTNLLSTTTFNKLGRPFKSSSVDEGVINIIYDTEGKVRFTQNALQAVSGKFSYRAYDRSGRLIEIGEYNPSISSTGTPLTFQSYNADGSSPASPSTNNVHHVSILESNGWIYGNRSTQQTYYAYDLPQSDFPTTPAGYSSYNQKYKDGLISKSWNSNNSNWYGYDDLGRPIWVVNSISGLSPTKSTNYTYSNGLLDLVDYQREYSTERMVTKYVYDNSARLKEVKTNFDGSASYITRQKLEYYLHGDLKRNELGGNLQGLDYVYTINGLLKSVNEPTLTSRDPGKDSYAGAHSTFKQDVFGYTLDYYTNDYVRQNTLIETYTPSGSNTSLPELYSGQIKSNRWKTTIPVVAQSNSTHVNDIIQFSYKYDNKNQLTEAIFGTISAGTINNNGVSPASPLFTEATNEYRINNITYDKIGNIKTLKRQGKLSNLPMDDLVYSYDDANSKPNRLIRIFDNATSSYIVDIQPNQTTTNYQYNEIGQLVKDVQSDYNYSYNIYGNVTAIKKSSGVNIITLEYNSLGLRQKKVNYDGLNNIVKTTWYVYGADGTLMSTYETVASTTTQIDIQAYGGGKLGVYNRPSTSFVYELTDHLGNVRSTIRDNAGSLEMLSYSDYYPHGSVIPGRDYSSSILNKFGYQGQEKDGETGFLNFELRQYDPRIGRWFNPDPMGQYHSPYLAMGNNPISRIDPTGGVDKDQDGWDDGDLNHDGQSDDLFSDNFDDNLWTTEFNNNYHGLPNGAGFYGADGGVTSNFEMSLDALNLYFDNHKIDGVTGTFQDFFTAPYKVENQGSNETSFAGQQDIITKWISSFDRKSYGQSINDNKKKAKKWEWNDPKPKGAYDYCFTYDECQNGALIVGGIAMAVVAAPVIVQASVAYAPIAASAVSDGAISLAARGYLATEKYYLITSTSINSIRQSITRTVVSNLGKYMTQSTKDALSKSLTRSKPINTENAAKVLEKVVKYIMKQYD